MTRHYYNGIKNILGAVAPVVPQEEVVGEGVVEAVEVKLVVECILVVVEVVPEVKADKHHHRAEPLVVWLEHHMLVKVEVHHEEARTQSYLYGM